MVNLKRNFEKGTLSPPPRLPDTSSPGHDPRYKEIVSGYRKQRRTMKTDPSSPFGGDDIPQPREPIYFS